MHVWSAENTLVFEANGCVQSMLMDLPVRLAVGGESYDAHYIYAAATLPEGRGKGMMGGLLRRAFVDGLSRGQHFSTLITQNDDLFNFYAPYGFQTVSAVRTFSVEPLALGEKYILRPASPGDIDALVGIYSAETRGTLAFLRDRDFFRSMLDLYGENLVVLLDESGDVKAYAFTENWGQLPVVSELFGQRKLELARALRNRFGPKTVFQEMAHSFPSDGSVRLGCVKPLTETGQAVLDTLEKPPYFNIMYN